MARQPDDLDIDNVEYAVLKAFRSLDRPLWKKRVHRFIDAHLHNMPLEDGVSAQTIGRRIDRLKYKRYLEQTIASPDEAPRNQIIAYTLTDKGEEAMETYRAKLLKHALMNHIFPENGLPELSKDAIICLMHDQYRFDEEMKAHLFDYDRETILAFLLIRYAQKEAVNILDHGKMGQYHDVLDDHPDLKEALHLQ